MSICSKISKFVVLATILVSPLFSGLHSSHHDNIIRRKDVVGTYQFSGFSNSLDTSTSPQSEALVGQLVFNRDGTGTISFVDQTAIVTGNLSNSLLTNLPFTYTLELQNGLGTITVPNFPGSGVTTTFAVSFKLEGCKVTGFSMVTSASTANPTPLWLLIQGVRFGS